MAEEYQKVYRTKSVNITLPKPKTNPWLDFTVQELYLNSEGEPVQLVDDVERYARRMDLVAFETVDFINPFTQQQETMYVGAIAEAVKMAVIKWMVEDGRKQYDPVTDRITDVENDAD